MKKFLTMLAAAALAVCLFALSACGGATSTLSSFVSAVKKSDYENASQFVAGQPVLSGDVRYSEDPYGYMWDQTVGSFSYSVEETIVNEDKNSTTISISYSCYSYTQLIEWVYGFISSGAITEDEIYSIPKSDVKAQLKTMDKVKGTTSVLLISDNDGDWLLSEASANALIAIMLCS